VRTDDAGVGASQLRDEQLPPPLAADADEEPPPRPPIPPEVLSAIEEKISELTARLDAFERMKRAEQALFDLEDRIAAELPPPQNDDDMELLN
jgi:hypothetical protein